MRENEQHRKSSAGFSCPFIKVKIKAFKTRVRIVPLHYAKAYLFPFINGFFLRW